MMIRKRFCAFLRTDGQCAFRREMCKFEHDDAPCPDAVRRVVHREGDEAGRLRELHLETAQGRFRHQTAEARAGDVYWACKRKGRYRTENDARRGARKMAFRYGQTMYFYCCPYCHGFHLTKRENKEGVAL